MKIPKYPDDFYMIGDRRKEVTDEEINEMVNKGIEVLNENKDVTNYSTTKGDVLVIIDRVHNDEGHMFEISVCRQHERGFVEE
ncbi:hypothetical protein ACJ2A9_11250 [Anaerobacillus sp. MEB173]|uniref:hypothetical protein n=1 Tax=Anaerobacillus sp. MEB173 TaxID=3383345 RepID=UPI003F8F589F